MIRGGGEGNFIHEKGGFETRPYTRRRLLSLRSMRFFAFFAVKSRPLIPGLRFACPGYTFRRRIAAAPNINTSNTNPAGPITGIATFAPPAIGHSTTLPFFTLKFASVGVNVH